MKTFSLLYALVFFFTATRLFSQGTVSKVELGSAVRLELASRDLLESLTWWARFGFSPIRRPGDRVDSALTMTDGQIVITLVKKSQPSPALIFRTEDLEKVKQDLDALGFRSDVDTQDKVIREIRLRSPNNVFVTIRNKRAEPEIRATTEKNPICGKLTELSTGATVLGDEKDWWTKLGFSVLRGDKSPYPFVNMTSGFTEVGIHEGRAISSLAMTYFMPDMALRISRLKTQGLEPNDTAPGPDAILRNAIFVSPDGQLLYLFEGDR